MRRLPHVAVSYWQTGARALQRRKMMADDILGLSTYQHQVVQYARPRLMCQALTIDLLTTAGMRHGRRRQLRVLRRIWSSPHGRSI
mmetsp:Transcript_87172/g.244594  ORF Transcript_87172/g.244594 Transcript_87172/m.244594 type:complete len:86 (+) Transcript_87172:302-559(+)